MEEKCYSVGNCSPEEEPTGTTEEKCRTFEKSLQCMREALDACRQLPNLPTEFVATVEEVLSEMKNELDMRKGISQSALPYRRSVPTWLKLTSEDVQEQIFKLAKKGLKPSQIGVILRDSHGVAQVRFVTGNKILRILKAKGLAPDLPEDLYSLIKKAVNIRKHLERNRKDKDAKFRLILVESRIHRLARYYKTKKVLAPNWK
nr:hypothetical protein BaRGS_016290 [Batillaria attramentaria]